MLTEHGLALQAAGAPRSCARLAWAVRLLRCAVSSAGQTERKVPAELRADQPRSSSQLHAGLHDALSVWLLQLAPSDQVRPKLLLAHANVNNIPQADCYNANCKQDHIACAAVYCARLCS